MSSCFGWNHILMEWKEEQEKSYNLLCLDSLAHESSSAWDGLVSP